VLARDPADRFPLVPDPAQCRGIGEQFLVAGRGDPGQFLDQCLLLLQVSIAFSILFLALGIAAPVGAVTGCLEAFPQLVLKLALAGDRYPPLLFQCLKLVKSGAQIGNFTQCLDVGDEFFAGPY
jgi:hypothetical protein